MERAIDSTAKALATIGQHVGSNKEQGPSKSFQMLIKTIGEAKTKHEEDRIIKKESIVLKDRIGAADITPRQMRELLIRLIYCEMLGVECSWGYIHAVKMTQSSNIMDKRIGYLASSLFLHEHHELNMLLVNTLQRDLKSSNMMLVSMALIITCKLIGAEMIPPLLPLVQEKLFHPKELVRKKAVMVMYKFYLLSPGTVDHLENDFRRCLSDKDPGVMEAALILLHAMTADDPSRFKDLAPSFSNILSQVVTRKLTSDFDYHGVPAPWIQIRILRILALLGADDLKTSENFYSVIEQVLGSAECNSNIGQAISYECIKTISTIYPNSALIDTAAKTISRFVMASNNSWKYLGITALASLVQINPKYAGDHQGVVIDCLDDPDDTLKRKTLDLLYKMTNPSNVMVITDRLIAYLRVTRDHYIKSDLVGKVTQLAERFAPDNLWFIQTMNVVFELGGSLVRKEVAHNLMRLIAEGTEDEETDNELQLDAVSSYLELLDKPHLPDILIKIISWVVGEYAYLLEDIDTEVVLEKVTALLGSKFEEPDTCGWVVAAVTKLVSQLGHLPENVQSHIAVHLTSTATDVQQRCSELVELSQDMTLMQVVLPLDASCDDLEIDSSLSFLDTFVSEALAKGASSYKPSHLRGSSSQTRHKTSVPALQPSIKYEPYALPQSPPAPIYGPTMMDIPPSQRAVAMDDNSYLQAQSSATSLVNEANRGASSDYSYTPKDDGLAVKEKKWGKKGYTATPLSYEATPKQDAVPINVSERKPDSESRDKECVGVGDTSRGGGDGVAMVNMVQASVVPPTTEELKRKKLANQLFGGLSGPSRAPKGKQQRKGSSSSEAVSRVQSTGGVARGKISAPNKKPPTPEVDLLLDLQDIDFSCPSPTLKSAEDSVPTATANLTGLMANLDVHQSCKTTPMSPPPTQTNLLDLFDETQLPPPSSSDSLAVVNSTVSASKYDPLSELSMLNPIFNSDSNSISPPSMALSLMDTVGSIQVPPEFSKFPVSSDCDNKEVCRDVNIRLTLTKVFKLDQLVVVIHVTNQKQAPLPAVTMKIDPPTTMKATLVEEGEGLETNMSLPEFGTVTRVVVLVPSSPAINMSLRGQLSYKDHMATMRRVFFDTSIYVSDVVRPLKITTADFGKKWGTLAYEKKLKLSSSTSITVAQHFMDTMSSKFNFYPVEIIGMEGICAGTFLPSTICLVHGKVQKSHLDFWVRSPSSLLTDSLATLAGSSFK